MFAAFHFHDSVTRQVIWVTFSLAPPSRDTSSLSTAGNVFPLNAFSVDPGKPPDVLREVFSSSWFLYRLPGGHWIMWRSRMTDTQQIPGLLPQRSMQSNICEYHFFFLHDCVEANTSSHIRCSAVPFKNPHVRFPHYDFRPISSWVQNQSAWHLLILDKWCTGWSIAVIYVEFFPFRSVESLFSVSP